MTDAASEGAEDLQIVRDILTVNNGLVTSKGNDAFGIMALPIVETMVLCVVRDINLFN